MQRVDVVPWSIEATKSANSDAPVVRRSQWTIMATVGTDIDTMPRGGPNASWLDRRLETGCVEYLDRDDVDERIKRSVVRSLEWTGDVFKNHERFAYIALEEVADVPDPRILELGAGHGGLSRKLLEQHPTARVTVTDIDATSVLAIAEGELGSNPRATVQVADATEIDAPDRSFDLAVSALTFHHLAPAQAAQVIAEGTRVADKLLIIDLPRPPSLLHIARLATMLPFAIVPFVHDGVISSLRAYSPSALRTLAAHAGPRIDVQLRGGTLRPQVFVATRR
jgi:ubiquinone/menaquinone biosynthesis C-methylase UbiE